MKKFAASVLCLFTVLISQAEINKVYISPNESLAIIDSVVEVPVDRYNGYPNHFSLKSANHQNKAKALYNVFLPFKEKGKDYMRYICKVPKNQLKLEGNGKIKSPFLLNTQFYYSERKPIDLVVVKGADDYKQIEVEWKENFKASLKEAISKNEDHELELLLYIKEFGKMPEQLNNNNWKRDELSKFIFSISGLNDIQDAIPTEKNFKMELHKYTETPPKMIQLPQVISKDAKLSENVAKSANFIPRSCYYLEVPSVEKLNNIIELTSSQLEEWTGQLYPKSINQLYKLYLSKLGLSEEDLIKHAKSIKTISVAGWDPYFQSGTNLMVVIEFKGKVNLKPKNPLHYIHENVLVVSTGKKLLSMSKKSMNSKKSLRAVDNFRYARNRLKATKKEDEQLFIYLSDYWLINFVSPRWRINTKRCAEADARIRMTELLKCVVKAEKGLKELPKLNELKQQFSDHKVITWFLNNLEEKDGKLFDRAIGGLYNQTPIDELPFDKVSKKEKSFYEDFKRVYRGRWEQIDPLAFQIVKTDQLFKTRLYISPISRRSFYRETQNLLLSVKQPHVRRRVKGETLGASIILKTDLIKGFIPHISLPLQLQPTITAFDFAPQSVKSNQIMEPFPDYDEISFFRIPAYGTLPTAIVDKLLGLVSRNQLRSIDRDGVDELFLGERFGSVNSFFKFSDDSGFSHLSIDPSTAQRAHDRSEKELYTEPVASDYHFFANFENGYMMHRYLLYQAVKNRGIANWRRRNRLYRAEQLLGADTQKISNFFPKPDQRYDGLVNCMPKLIGEKINYGSSLSRNFNKLPILLQKLLKVDLYASVEADALFFETHLKFKFQEPQTTNRVQERPEVEHTLDFDE